MGEVETLGARIRGLRTSRGLAQEQVASAIGVRTLSYGRWERDQQLPGLQNRVMLARFFDVDVRELADDIGDDHVELVLGDIEQGSPEAVGAGSAAGVEQRLTALEASVARCETMLERILQALRAGA